MNKLDVLIGWLTELKDFSQGQAPDVIKQLLEYSIFMDNRLMWICAGVCITALVLIVADFGTSDGPSGVGIIATIALVVFVIVGVSNYMELVKIEKAPKVFILEYVTFQLKNVTAK